MNDPRFLVAHVPAWHGTAGALQQLVDRAADWGGRGMNALASTCYGSFDWLLTRTSLHEAAHAVVAECFGVPATIHLESGARIGNGRCSFDAEQFWKAPPRAARLIGLAGSSAAQIAEYGHAADIARVHQHLTWPGTMSASDLKVAEGFTFADVSGCCDLVRKRWPAIAGRARAVLDTQLRIEGQRGLA